MNARDAVWRVAAPIVRISAADVLVKNQRSAAFVFFERCKVLRRGRGPSAR